MKRIAMIVLCILGGVVVAQVAGPKVVIYDPNGPGGKPAWIFSSDPNDVQAWYDQFIAPKVSAQVTEIMLDPEWSVFDPNVYATKAEIAQNYPTKLAVSDEVMIAKQWCQVAWEHDTGVAEQNAKTYARGLIDAIRAKLEEVERP